MKGLFIFLVICFFSFNINATNLKFQKSYFKSAQLTSKQLVSMKKFYYILVENKNTLYLEMLNSEGAFLFGKLKRNNPEIKKYKKRAERVRGGVGSVGLTPFQCGSVIRHILTQLGH